MTLKETREFFANDIYATEQTDIKIIEVSDHYSKCELEISRMHMNADNKVMGGVFYIDFQHGVAGDQAAASRLDQREKMKLRARAVFKRVAAVLPVFHKAKRLGENCLLHAAPTSKQDRILPLFYRILCFLSVVKGLE